MQLPKHLGKSFPWPRSRNLGKIVRVGPYLITIRYERPKMLQTEVTVGSQVRIDCPDNPRLHGQIGVVEKTEEWGAHLLVAAAATGRYRALHEEMRPALSPPQLEVQVEYTGNPCDMCGSLNQKRTGTCVTCQDCGANSGCA